RLDALARAEREARKGDGEIVALVRGLEDLVAGIDVIEVVAGPALEIVVAGAADQEVVAAEADEIVVAGPAIELVGALAAVQALPEFVAREVYRIGRVLVERDQRLDLIAFAQRVAGRDEDPVVAAADAFADEVRRIDIIFVVAGAADHVVGP